MTSQIDASQPRIEEWRDRGIQLLDTRAALGENVEQLPLAPRDPVLVEGCRELLVDEAVDELQPKSNRALIGHRPNVRLTGTKRQALRSARASSTCGGGKLAVAGHITPATANFPPPHQAASPATRGAGRDQYL